MAAAVILDLKFVKFYWQTVSGGPRRIIVLNVVKIGQSVAKILRFFTMAAVHHLEFVWGIFGPRTVSTWGSLSLCKISL